MIGKILGNRYEIVEKIGGGGMALVYRAKCTLLNREVTIKVLRSEYSSDDDFVTRFKREAQAVAKLSHANIVSIYDVGHEEDIQYIVMEYVEGKNLKEYIKEKGRLPEQEAIKIAGQIADALDHAHEHQIVHRDIKPHNILIANNGKVKVTDFGIARATTTATVTQAGTILGSVHYFSPEQAKGELTGPKSDIYSMGVVLYEMLTGRVPFEAETPIAIALKQIQETPIPPSQINPEVSQEMEKIIRKAMAKNPEERYKRAGEMWQDLHNLQIGSPTLAGKETFTDEFATQVITKEALDHALKEQGEKPAEHKDDKKNNKRIWWIVLGVIVLGLIMGAGLASIGLIFEKGEVAVPDVTNLSVEQARINLEAKGLEINVAGEEFDPEIAAGKIASQAPTPEAVVKEGRVVNVIVSKGQEMVQVPKVRGKTQDVAELDLGNAQLKVGKITEEFSDDYPTPGIIIAQFPDAFTNIAKGSEIELTISKGPEPKFIQVPAVTGKTLEEAKQILASNGLKLGQIKQQESDELFANIVISQDPAPGGDNRVREGTEVQLIVSSGPGPEARNFNVNLVDLIPDDGEAHQVLIKVNDAKDPAPDGRVVHEQAYIYEEAIDKTIEVEVFGEGMIEVWIDDVIKVRKNVN